LSFTLLTQRDQAWQDNFYATIRAGAGIPRENVIRGMMENRLKTH
jgi:hypothetical protein